MLKDSKFVRTSTSLRRSKCTYSFSGAWDIETVVAGLMCCNGNGSDNSEDLTTEYALTNDVDLETRTYLDPLESHCHYSTSTAVIGKGGR